MLETMRIDRNELDELLGYKSLITSGKFVQVVRCKDCEKQCKESCPMYDCVKKDTEYCSIGVRRK